jgi:outer membrane receptor for ferrienterochelin and colicins
MRKKQHLFYKLLSGIALCLTALYTGAQNGSIAGRVGSEEAPLEFANVFIQGMKRGATTNAEGAFKINQIPAGNYILKVTAVGFLPIERAITLESGQTLLLDFLMKRDILDLSQVVVTGSRKKIERYNSPVIVNTIGSKTFESVQALNVAEGLSFSPGLRVENNCQNCGFTQLRMNGLDGPYSQILINSRPVFSALAGVYGLEMLPSGMVDRIEVVRGGGSVMYGGNAIAGIVNIITKDPIENTFEIGLNQSLINGEVSDRSLSFNGAIVSDDLQKGISFFGLNRNREHWDANGDGFSEIVQLRNNTFGFDAFYNIDRRKKLKFGLYYINEYRRGGNKFHLFPHQTDVTEQLEHDILSANFSYEHLSKNEKHRFTGYASLQQVDRGSYYGGGGRIIQEGDTLSTEDVLAINAYGNSKDISTVSGLQYNYDISSKFTLTTGTEFIYNDVQDEMSGYERMIDQQVGTWGTFAELQYKPLKSLTLLLGGRFDQLNIAGRYNLSGEPFDNNQHFGVFVPRFTGLFEIRENLKLRGSFAQGYRGPQAFDEDLHIETVGGAARFIRLSPDLELERSNSAVLSLNYEKFSGKNQLNFVVEGFYTQLSNPFIFADQEELPNGVAIITKRNGEGATVTGLNLEANIALGRSIVLQSGASIQSANYDVLEEIWAPETPTEEVKPTTTRRLLRTPNTYGFFSLVYKPIEMFTLAYSGVFTGSMEVPHVIDVETERTVIKTSKSFFENNIKLTYLFNKEDQYKLEFFGGVQNLFNSYQDDFDTGADRDAGYVYGPLRPRTFFIGLKYGLD